MTIAPNKLTFNLQFNEREGAAIKIALGDDHYHLLRFVLHRVIVLLSDSTERQSPEIIKQKVLRLFRFRDSYATKSLDHLSRNEGSNEAEDDRSYFGLPQSTTYTDIGPAVGDWSNGKDSMFSILEYGLEADEADSLEWIKIQAVAEELEESFRYKLGTKHR